MLRRLDPSPVATATNRRPDKGRWIGPLGRSTATALLSPGSEPAAVFFLARQNKTGLAILRGLLQAGKATPVIYRTYLLSEPAEAIRYQENGYAKGKVAITVEPTASL